MNVIEDDGIDALASLLGHAEDSMEHVPRWANYIERGATLENDRQHTFTACPLSAIVVEALQEQASAIGASFYPQSLRSQIEILF